MVREKSNLIPILKNANETLVGDKRLSLAGQGDFPGANNSKRTEMNTKHHSQHLVIDEPEFPLMFDGKENVVGKHSSFHMDTDKPYEVIDIIKKYDEKIGRAHV